MGLHQRGRGGSKAAWTRDILKPRFKQEGPGCSWEPPHPLNLEGKLCKVGRNGQRTAKGRAGPQVGFWPLLQAGREHGAISERHHKRVTVGIIDFPGECHPALRDLLGTSWSERPQEMLL